MGSFLFEGTQVISKQNSPVFLGVTNKGDFCYQNKQLTKGGKRYLNVFFLFFFVFFCTFHTKIEKKSKNSPCLSPPKIRPFFSQVKKWTSIFFAKKKEK